MDKSFSAKVLLNLFAAGYVVAEWAPGWLAKLSGLFLATPLTFVAPWSGTACASALVLLVIYCTVLGDVLGIGLGASKELVKIGSQAGVDLAHAGADAAKVSATAVKASVDSIVSKVEVP